MICRLIPISGERRIVKMKDSITGVVGGVIVAMIHKEMFANIKTNEERREAIAKAIVDIGKAFD